MWDAPIKTLQGEDTKLGDYKGKALLLVNVASECGLTPQYTALEALQQHYEDQGFSVIGSKAQHLRIIGDAFLHAPQVIVRPRTIKPGVNIIGVQTKGLGVVGNRPVMATHFVLGGPTIQIGVGQVRP